MSSNGVVPQASRFGFDIASRLLRSVRPRAQDYFDAAGAAVGRMIQYPDVHGFAHRSQVGGGDGCACVTPDHVL
jgi:hypothetical protein